MLKVRCRNREKSYVKPPCLCAITEWALIGRTGGRNDECGRRPPFLQPYRCARCALFKTFFAQVQDNTRVKADHSSSLEPDQ